MTPFSVILPAIAAAFMLAAGPAFAAEGDVTRGKKVFKKCKACHTLKKGKNRIGPTLFGVVGSKAASVPKFRYSSAMKSSGLTWDEATLDKYLAKPKKLVPKTKMKYPGLKKPQQRADVIAYLKGFK